MSPRPRPALLAVLPLLLLAGCGDGGSTKKTDSGNASARATDKGPKAAATDLPGDGPILLIDDAGHLKVIDAVEGQPLAIEAPAVDKQRGGVAVRAPGIAFFQTEDGGLLMVDAVARSAKVVGNLEEAGGSLYQEEDQGGGRRFAAFTDQYGAKGLIVDIQAGLSRPISDFRAASGEFGAVGEVRVSSNEQFAFVRGDREVRLIPLAGGLAAAGAGRVIPGSRARFNAEGTAVFTAESVEKPPPDDSSFWEKVRRVPLDGAGEEVLVEKADAFLGVVGDAALYREGPKYTLVGHPGDGRPVDFGASEGELAFIPQSPVDGGVLATLSTEGGDRFRFALVDPGSASVKYLGALDGFKGRAARPAGAWLVFTDIRLPEFTGYVDGETTTSTNSGPPLGKGTYAVLHAGTGELRTVPFDFGPAQKDVRVALSPGGLKLAVTRRGDDYRAPPVTSFVPLDGGKVTDFEGGFFGWSPSGSAFVAGRAIGDALHHLVVDQGKEREIGVGLDGVVWTAK